MNLSFSHPRILIFTCSHCLSIMPSFTDMRQGGRETQTFDVLISFKFDNRDLINFNTEIPKCFFKPALNERRLN